MDHKPFIHPEILLTIKEVVGSDKDHHERDDYNYDDAKNKGEQFAYDILDRLFPSENEFGEIASHFNTERLNSPAFSSFRDQIISMHQQRKVLNEKLVETKRKFENKSTSLQKTK